MIMEEGIDDFDEIDATIQDDEPTGSFEGSQDNEDDIIGALLKDKGIADRSQINIEDENGEITQMDWDSLDREEQLNILRFSNQESNINELDDSEIDLINSIRSSKMNPSEYLNYISRTGVERYLLNTQSQYQPHYSIDELSDDELFVADLIAKLGQDNITDQEINDVLDTEKTNLTVYRKKIEAIRNEYRKIEEDNRRTELQYAYNQRVQLYNQFAESIENEIRNFTNVLGFDLNMDEEEMEEIYDFITGQDAAGVSIFSKALNDPKILVRMAWYALNGELAIQDMTDYWTNEIKNVRQNSYNKGVSDAQNGKINRKSNMVIKSSKRNTYDDDLDDF